MSHRCEDLEPFLSAWLDGELDTEQAGRLAAHTHGCPDCAAVVEELRSVRTLLRSLPARRMPAPVYHELGQQLGDEQPATASLRLARAASAFVLVAGLLVGMAFTLGEAPDEPPRTVTVPIEVFVADHLSQTAGGPVSTPMRVDEGR